MISNFLQENTMHDTAKTSDEPRVGHSYSFTYSFTNFHLHFH